MFHKDLLRRFNGNTKAIEAYANSNGYGSSDMDRVSREAAARTRNRHVAFHKLGKK